MDPQACARRWSRWLVLAFAAIALNAAVLPAAAGPDSSTKAEIRRLEREFDAQYDAGDWAGAEVTLRRLTTIDKDNFVPPYNLACALSMQSKLDEAGEFLKESVARGFSDIRQLKSDPNLRALHGTDLYETIVRSWDEIIDARAEARLEQARTQFGPAYTFETDPSLRLQYASAFNAKTFAQAKLEVNRLAKWWIDDVRGPDDPLAANRPAPWVLVVLPTRADFQQWAVNRYGAIWQNVGGAYSDDEKQLVAQDLGPTIRHEFWHVLHWRDMRARGQLHPTWIMEGLCSLVEDVDVGPDGEMVVLPSWRTNKAKKRARAGSLMPWSRLFEMSQKRFVMGEPLSRYAESRAIFLYLAHKKKLAEWYAQYTSGYDEDPSGRLAFERVFGKPVDQVERDYRAWLRVLPEVPEEIQPGMATFPFQMDAGDGDGIVITSLVSAGPTGGGFSQRRGQRPQARPDTGGLRMRDVIMSVDDKPVREMSELVRVLSQYHAGDEVEVAYRRGTLTGTARLKLVTAR
ncbi:MAG: PDZ domain-containing protein [Phycisphaeraceae bacterium]|nr:PDZ domain-containing protein [Phycisphaeraceae bacterium]